jgi:transketolase
MRDSFLGEIHARMASRPDLFFLTADFGSPRLDAMRAEHPERCVNVGIAEQNLINISLGLALEGFCVFAYAISPFITMRCFEQIRVNLALHSQVQPVNVNLVGVGAGMSYDMSGPTHHCLEDLSIMRTLPGLELHSPSDPVVAAAMVPDALDRKAPKYFRLDGKALPALEPVPAPGSLDRGFRVLRSGRFLVLTTGYMSHLALRVADRLPSGSLGVIDLLRLRPLATDDLTGILAGCQGAFSLEEGFLGAGGLDAFTSHLLREAGLPGPLACFGVEQRYLFHGGGREALHAGLGLSEEALAERIQAYL